MNPRQGAPWLLVNHSFCYGAIVVVEAQVTLEHKFHMFLRLSLDSS